MKRYFITAFDLFEVGPITEKNLAEHYYKDKVPANMRIGQLIETEDGTVVIRLEDGESNVK